MRKTGKSRLGGEGSGPDELQSAFHAGFDKANNLIVKDIRQQLFKKFDLLNGETEQYSASLLKDGYYSGQHEMMNCGEDWFMGIYRMGTAPDSHTPAIAQFDRNFNVTNKIGSVHDYFKDEIDVHISPVIRVDCEQGIVYKTHHKLPFISIYNYEQDSLYKETEHIPDSFRLSSEFIEMAGGEDFQEYMINEQSLSAHLAFNDDYLFHIYLNETEDFYESHDYRDRAYHTAVYERGTYTYLTSIEMENALVGSTNSGSLIELADDDPENFTLRFLEIELTN